MDATQAAFDPEPLRRQAVEAARTWLRPGACGGLAREVLAAAGHALVYPLGLLPAAHAATAAVSPAPAGQAAPCGAPGAAGAPVVLVHGFVANGSAFLALRRTLHRTGFRAVTTFSYDGVRSDPRDAAVQLRREVEGVLSATGADRCLLVGHSLGGLVARAYVQDLGGEDTVDTVVTLGTPHRGTYASYLGVGPALAAMRPGSVFLRDLEQTARPSAVRWIAYHSSLDALVRPSRNAMLEHPALQATNVRLEDTGHLSLLVSGTVLRGIAGHLWAASARSAGRPPAASA